MATKKSAKKAAAKKTVKKPATKKSAAKKATQKTLTIKSANGVSFLVRVVRKGDRYGRNDSIVHNDVDPLIEFYDRRHRDPDFKHGQFVSRYYASTLAEGLPSGIALYGDEPSWRIDAKAVLPVVALAKKIHKTPNFARETFLSVAASTASAKKPAKKAKKSVKLPGKEFAPNLVAPLYHADKGSAPRSITIVYRQIKGKYAVGWIGDFVSTGAFQAKTKKEALDFGKKIAKMAKTKNGRTRIAMLSHPIVYSFRA